MSKNKLIGDPVMIQMVLGQICHHIGEEIKNKCIEIHGSSISQGEALSAIGSILKTYHHTGEDPKLREIIKKELNLLNNDFHICEVAQILLCNNWEEKLKERFNSH